MFARIAHFFRCLFDCIGLVLSQLLTLGGWLRFASVDEIANQRHPARWMRWNERKRLLNEFNGGFLLDGKVGRLSRRVAYAKRIQDILFGECPKQDGHSCMTLVCMTS